MSISIMDILKILRDEITLDPLNRGYSSMSRDEKISSLKEKNRVTYIIIPSSELLAWAAGGGRLQKLIDASENPIYPGSIRSICRAAVLLIERDGTSLNLNNPNHVALLDALITAGILSVAEKNELFSLAKKMISREEELGLFDVGLGLFHSAGLE